MTWWTNCLIFLKTTEDSDLSKEMNYIARELNK